MMAGGEQRETWRGYSDDELRRYLRSADWKPEQIAGVEFWLPPWRHGGNLPCYSLRDAVAAQARRGRQGTTEVCDEP